MAKRRKIRDIESITPKELKDHLKEITIGMTGVIQSALSIGFVKLRDGRTAEIQLIIETDANDFIN